ncbi:MAG: hypothetical protein E6Q97_05150 [Desulfurellales bacterium]|nr:MAG: hypothetical protein E6Q97_05150 [Desulfurellales bacterium]
MTWSDYQVPTVMIDTGDGKERPVRGLSLDDMSALIVNHLDAMMEITTLYIQTQKDVLAVTNMTDLVMVAVRTFPDFISEVISIVTDTPELRKVRLPAGLQLKVIQASLKLTIEDAGGLGNLSAMLQNAVKAAVAGRGEVSQKLGAILSPSSTSGAGKMPTS